MPPFDRVIIVDWSASSAPSAARPSAARPSAACPSADAIRIGEASASGETTTCHRTRTAAEAALTATLAGQDRVLIGFDFPMGYPAGFAKRLTDTASPKAVHLWLAAAIQDGPDNRNNRFTVAAQINRMFAAEGPFRGCPASQTHAGLYATKRIDDPALGLTERRHVETLIPRAQPVWKLYTTGSVGSQSLMGLPLIHRLGLPVWPFDPPAPRMVAAVYPSLLATAVAARPGIKDAAQVRLLARALFRLSQAGTLAPLFATPPIATEEGWILGAGHAPVLAQALTWA